MFSFHLGPGTDILFENLTAQIGARLRLGPLLRFEAPGELREDIVKMQQFLVRVVRVSEAVPLAMSQRLAFGSHSKSVFIFNTSSSDLYF